MHVIRSKMLCIIINYYIYFGIYESNKSVMIINHKRTGESERKKGFSPVAGARKIWRSDWLKKKLGEIFS